MLGMFVKDYLLLRPPTHESRGWFKTGHNCGNCITIMFSANLKLISLPIIAIKN